jgi:hypothetical protein
VRLVASPEAVNYVAEHGGQLFFSPKRGRCARSVTWLETSTDPDPRREWRKVVDEPIEVFGPAGLARLPAELHVEVRRFPRRHVEAYWDGCVWVV